VYPASLVILAAYIAVQRFEFSARNEFILNALCLSILLIQALLIVNIWVRYLLSQDGPLGLQNTHLRVLQGTLTTVAIIAVWVVGLLMLFDNLGFNVTTILAGLGIGGIAVGLALQSVFGDMIASFIIGLDQPFEAGDFISFDGLSGTIEKVGLKTTRIRSLGGELLIIPNNKLVNTNIQNFTKMKERRIAFTVKVSYDNDPAKLEQIPNLLKQIIAQQSQVRFDRAHLLNYGDWSINYEVVYFVLNPDYNLYMDIQQRINFAMQDKFNRLKITLALQKTLLSIDEGHQGRLVEDFDERPVPMQKSDGKGHTSASSSEYRS